MEGFARKSIESKRGYTWTYYVSEGDRSLPAILMLHGWPDHAQMWSGVVTELKKQKTPHSIIIPDVLGYGDTSKPTEESAYQFGKISSDLVDILDAEGLQKVISTGHDWGAAVAQRLYNYFPERVASLITLNVAYQPPSKEKFNLDATNAMMEKAFGYPSFAYWYLFADPDNGPSILKNNVERLYSAMHAEGGDSMRKFFCTHNGIKDYLLSDEKEVEVRPYAQDPKLKEAFVQRMQRDGFEGPQCYYKAMRFGYQDEGEASIPEQNYKINVPVLYVGCTQDAVCRPEAAQPAIQAGLLPDYEGPIMIDAGHWGVYEKPEETGAIIAEYLSRKFPAK